LTLLSLKILYSCEASVIREGGLSVVQKILLKNMSTAMKSKKLAPQPVTTNHPSIKAVTKTVVNIDDEKTVEEYLQEKYEEMVQVIVVDP
jgi:hypothetical protein